MNAPFGFICVVTILMMTFSLTAARSRTNSITKGWLMLEGGGRIRNADTIRRFIQLAGGPDARLVSIDTAALALSKQKFDQAYIAHQRQWIMDVFGVRHVSVIHTFDRAEADSDSFVKPLRTATAVWIWGGSHEALVKAYVDTKTEKELRGLLARGGIVGGGSAGAMTLGSYMAARDEEASPEHPEGGHRLLTTRRPFDTGFGFLANSVIDAHVGNRRREEDLGQVISVRPGLLGVGIDETTALLVHGDEGEVVGEGHVRIWDGRMHGEHPYLLLSNGQHFNLRTRSQEPAE